MQQYIARIQLLDAGLIAESHEVAKFMPTPRDDEPEQYDDEEEDGGVRAKKDKKAKPSMAIDPETAADFILKLKKYVKGQLHRAAKTGGTKDAYKDGLVYTERRALLDEVLRVQQRPWRTKCSRCQA
jgi:DNA-directed RNA polymerase I subunit RPA1